MLKHSFPAATLTLALLAAPLPGCSSGNDSSGGGGSDLTGTYNTDVTLVSSTCPFPVQDNPTTVRVSGNTITLTHAGNSYSGILNPADSTFATQEKVVGGVYHIAIAGDFTAAGLDAQVTVNWSNTPCNAVVHWVGPKN